MADAVDLKSTAREGVSVRPRAGPPVDVTWVSTIPADVVSREPVGEVGNPVGSEPARAMASVLARALAETCTANDLAAVIAVLQAKLAAGGDKGR